MNQRPSPAKSGASPSTFSFAPAVACAVPSKRDFPRSSASRSSIGSERSSEPVGLTRKPGACSASAVWKRRSACVTIASAVTIITMPSARWSTGGLTRESTRRPPRQKTSSTAAVPIA